MHVEDVASECKWHKLSNVYQFVQVYKLRTIQPLEFVPCAIKCMLLGSGLAWLLPFGSSIFKKSTAFPTWLLKNHLGKAALRSLGQSMFFGHKKSDSWKPWTTRDLDSCSGSNTQPQKFIKLWDDLHWSENGEVHQPPSSCASQGSNAMRPRAFTCAMWW